VLSEAFRKLSSGFYEKGNTPTDAGFSMCRRQKGMQYFQLAACGLKLIFQPDTYGHRMASIIGVADVVALVEVLIEDAE
jgi:hypothetical protein